jgi:hypothetical protein
MPTTREVLEVCATQRLVVRTGHSFGEEALALIAAAMTETQTRRAAAMGAKSELCAGGMLVGAEGPVEWMRHSVRVPPQGNGARSRGQGAQHFVLGTDLGETRNPTPADGLQTRFSEMVGALGRYWFHLNRAVPERIQA